MSCCTTDFPVPNDHQLPYEVGTSLLYLWIHRNKVTTPMQSTAVVNLKSIAPSWTSDIPSCKASCTTSYALQSSCITSCTPSCTACAAPSLHTIFLHILHTILKKSILYSFWSSSNAKVKRETHTRNEKKICHKCQSETRNVKHETRNTKRTVPQLVRRNAVTIQLPSQPLHCDMRSWNTRNEKQITNVKVKRETRTRDTKRETLRITRKTYETRNEKRAAQQKH